MIQIAKLQFNPFGENTYILYGKSGECIIVDPGCSNAREWSTLTAFVAKNNLKPIIILATHGHVDHVCGADFLVNEYKVPFALSSADAEVLTSNLEFAASMGFDMERVPKIDIDLSKTKQITLDGEVIEIIPTPGHTQGGVCLLMRDQKVMLTGDTLFHGSIGRTDLPGGDYKALMGSILNNLLPLGGDVKFFPGHGSESTLANEATYNPFITEVLNKEVNY